MPEITKIMHNGCAFHFGGGGGKVDVLIVGGGGGGGHAISSASGGGGGAGGVIIKHELKIPLSESFHIVIGSGGAQDVSGGDSSAFGLIAGGGGAGGYGIGCLGCFSSRQPMCYVAKNGGSGGGSGRTYYQCNSYNCGNGASGYATGEGIGHRGGDTLWNAGCTGGGGGAGSVGVCCTNSTGTGGFGGEGIVEPISCKNMRIAGGGSGGGIGCSSQGSPLFEYINHDFGGGKPGVNNGLQYAKGGNATCYGGGGGGGAQCGYYALACSCNGGSGYAGIVVVRYKTDGSCGITNATGGTVYTCGGYKIHCFTSSGTFCPVFK